MIKRLIFEPTTFSTNVILLIIAFYFGQRLAEVYWRSYHPFHFHLGWSFYALAAGAFMGALFHGLGPHFSEMVREWIWKGALLGMGFTTFFLMMAGLTAVASHETARIFMWVAILGLVLFLWQTVRFAGFGHSVKFLSVGLIFVFTAFATLAWQQGASGGAHLLTGVIIALAAGGVWATGWTPHKNFNHNDLFHVIQMVSLWFLYKGGILTKASHLPA